VKRVTPGLAFSIASSAGFGVGLVTHRLPRFGDVVWVAEPLFAAQPTLADVAAIDRWRWPTLFATGAAMRNGNVAALGVVPVPAQFHDLPPMRSGVGSSWVEVRWVDGDPDAGGRTDDRTLPVLAAPTSAMLAHWLDTDWKPEDDW
jgi:hypothetical protein